MKDESKICTLCGDKNMVGSAGTCRAPSDGQWVDREPRDQPPCKCKCVFKSGNAETAASNQSGGEQEPAVSLPPDILRQGWGVVQEWESGHSTLRLVSAH